MRGIAAHNVAQGDEEPQFLSTQEAALKLLYLALRNVPKKWQKVQDWREALRQSAIRRPDRIE